MTHRYLFVAAVALPLFLSCEKIDFTTTNEKSAENSTATQFHNNYIDTDYHVIALSETIATDKVSVIYISLKEWDNMTSTYSPNTAQDALAAATSYSEGSVSGWRIPSRDEARRINSLYGSDNELLDILNEKLMNIGASPLCTTDSKGNTYRYLCANGDSTFSIRQGSSTLKAGATVKYHLRLVKDSTFTITPSEIRFGY